MNGRPVPPVPEVEHRTDPFEQSKALFSQGQYEAAINENQKIIQDRTGSPDIALFNMGMISAHPTNPRKNYPRALSSFRTLVKEYPQSAMVDPAKTWITVLEEHQKIADEKRTLSKER
jgi:TolA-binding protein